MFSTGYNGRSFMRTINGAREENFLSLSNNVATCQWKLSSHNYSKKNVQLV